jgi:uncharacterized protein
MVVYREFNDKFVCLAYGMCCIKYQPCINESELIAISGYLGIETEEFIKNYTDHRWPGTTSYLIRHNENGCVFLKEISGSRLKLCSIQQVKPRCCREWDAAINKNECRQCLKQMFNLIVDENGRIAGNISDINNLLNYLKHPIYY